MVDAVDNKLSTTFAMQTTTARLKVEPGCCSPAGPASKESKILTCFTLELYVILSVHRSVITQIAVHMADPSWVDPDQTILSPQIQGKWRELPMAYDSIDVGNCT